MITLVYTPGTRKQLFDSDPTLRSFACLGVHTFTILFGWSHELMESLKKYYQASCRCKLHSETKVKLFVCSTSHSIWKRWIWSRLRGNWNRQIRFAGAWGLSWVLEADSCKYIYLIFRLLSVWSFLCHQKISSSDPLMPVFQSLRLAKLDQVLMKKGSGALRRKTDWFSLYIVVCFCCWNVKPRHGEKHRFSVLDSTFSS